ncbi:rhamnulokinase family protein [Kineococcus gynurae]|uniref:Rhamnulokinase family protein n=1 Tax=Kineococcus gynurae TaxID=452979 RepID=A0ABV5LR07_9ACTN
MSSFAAVDLGATSGRVVVGTVVDGSLRMEPVARFENTPVRLPDGWHTDVLALYAAALAGVGRASREVPDLESLAVDSWAVDHGLLRGGRLLGNPYHYRDDRTAAAVEDVHARIGAAELFSRNGLQHQPFNTVFQLVASARVGDLALADRVLLLPDLFGFWTTGHEVAEITNASTTGLLPVARPGRADDWDRELLATLDLPGSVLPELVAPGTSLGAVRDDVATEFGISGAVTVTAVGSHDTASAVVAVPLGVGEGAGDAAYLSCGTWSLIGAELDSPVLSEEARCAEFTNERGVDGRTRFLKNVMGLWLVSETLRTWAKQGRPADLNTLLEQAAAVEGPVPVFDVNDPRLLAPGDMPARIAELLGEQGDPVPTDPALLVRCILQSLARAYASALHDVDRLTGRRTRTLHLVGGGARNTLLCRLTAEAVGIDVVAGPVEATAIGNLLVQARTHGLLSGDLEALRRVVARSFPPRVHRAGATTNRG